MDNLKGLSEWIGLHEIVDLTSINTHESSLELVKPQKVTVKLFWLNLLKQIR